MAAAAYLYIEDQPAVRPNIQVGLPAVTFSWDSTKNKHTHVPADDATFNLTARSLQKQRLPHFVIAAI